MKLLKQIEHAATETPVATQTITPENSAQVLSEGKELIIKILEFIKFFTSDAADLKIDQFIEALNVLPVTPNP